MPDLLCSDAAVSAIFRWVDPVESALVFLVANFFYLVITFGDYSVLTLVCTVHCAAIVVCATWAACNLLLSLATKKAKENTLTYVSFITPSICRSLDPSCWAGYAYSPNWSPALSPLCREDPITA